MAIVGGRAIQKKWSYRCSCTIKEMKLSFCYGNYNTII